MADLFRTPDERFDRLPGYASQPNWHNAGGLRLHYVDEGQGDPVVSICSGPLIPAAGICSARSDRI